MGTAFGTSAWAGIAPESTYGTYVAPTNFLEIMEESIKGEQSWIGKDTLSSPSQNQRIPSKKSVGGGFKMNFPFEGAEKLLEHAMGARNTTSLGGGLYRHDFTLATALPTGLSIHMNRDAASVGTGSAFKYVGCQIEKLTLKQVVEGAIEMDVSFVGQDWSNINVATPTFPTLKLIDWTQLGVAQYDSQNLKMSDFEMTIDNTLATDRYYIGSRIRRGLGRNAPRKVTGKFTLEYDSLTLYAYSRDLVVPKTMLLAWSNGGGGFVFNIIANASLSGEPSVSDAGPVKAPYEFTCYQNSAANDELVLQLTNTIASP